MVKQDEKIAIRINKELKDAIIATGISISVFIREAIIEKLKKVGQN